VAEREVGGEGVPVWEVVGLGEGSSTFTVEILLKLICCRSEEALLGSPRGEPAVEIPLTAGVGKSGKLSLTTLT
jgi:hypothetical protein